MKKKDHLSSSSSKKPEESYSNYSIINRLNLSELDRQLIDCTTNSRSSISYNQLYDIARSIIAIDFGQTHNNKSSSSETNVQDQEEFEKTLTKILQLCQTIIDFLLADIKRLEIERTELKDRNNLIQENLKLRKLLQLQQRAIIYGRTNMITNITDCSSSSAALSATINNHQDEYEEDNSLENLDQLPSDSKSNSHDIINNSSLAISAKTSKFQCFYCSKIFNNPKAFSKHLQLRHLTLNLDDPSTSLGSSLSSNLTLIQRLFQQHCCFKQQQQPKLSIDSSLSEEKVHRLQDEIRILKDKLSKTEIQLEEEKMARKTFENDFKCDFQEQVKTIWFQIEKKIENMQASHEQFNINHDNRCLFDLDNLKDEKEDCGNALKTKSKKSNQLQKTSKIMSKLDSKISTEDSKVSKTDEMDIKEGEINIKEKTPIKTSKSLDDIKQEQSNELDQNKTEKFHPICLDSLHDLEIEDTNNENMEDRQLKQSLRMELISQLTLNREQRQREMRTKNTDLTPTESIKKQDSKSTKNESSKIKSNSKPPLKKVSVELEKQQEPYEPPAAIKTIIKDQTKAEIHQSIEARIKSYLDSDSFHLKSTDLQKQENVVDEIQFHQAMDRIHQDRSLLIQQSRHDYDFVRIENSIRDMIDSKVRNKINNQHDQESVIEQQSKIDKTDPESKPKIVEILNENNNKDNLDDKTLHLKSENPKINQNEKNSLLKSILKDPKTNSHNVISKRNITFNNEVVEFEISPLGSDDENWEDSEDYQENCCEPEVEIIKSSNNNNNKNVIDKLLKQNTQTFMIGDDLNLALQHSSSLSNHYLNRTTSFDGEKIFPENDNNNNYREMKQISPTSSSSTTSSTTNSDDENEEQKPSQISLQSNHHNQQLVTVDIHHYQTSKQNEIHDDSNENVNSMMVQQLPIPAKRRNIPTANNEQQRSSSSNRTLDSLLFADYNDETSKITNFSSDSTSNQQSTLRVYELAELIEKKLQSPERSSLTSTINDHKKLPPLGSMMNLKKTSSPNDYEQTSIEHDDNTLTKMANNFDLNLPNNNRQTNVLDVYDLYEF